MSAVWECPTAPRRPLLRYHGGKWRLAPWIIDHMPPHRVYVEPFCGAASVLLRKPRSHAEVINDLDGGVVNLFRVLREGAAADRLVDALYLTPFAREEFDLAQRDDDPGLADPVERARRLVVRSRPYRTGFRANSNRSNTVPAHDWANMPRALEAIVERLRGVVIENRDAVEVIEQQDRPETLFYADPPYLGSTRQRSHRAGRGTYRHEMLDEEGHRRLSAKLRRVRGMVLLSAYPSPLYDELYAGWRRVERVALADGGGRRREVLWLNDAAATGALRQLEIDEGGGR